MTKKMNLQEISHCSLFFLTKMKWTHKSELWYIPEHRYKSADRRGIHTQLTEIGAQIHLDIHLNSSSYINKLIRLIHINLFLLYFPKQSSKVSKVEKVRWHEDILDSKENENWQRDTVHSTQYGSSTWLFLHWLLENNSIWFFICQR